MAIAIARATRISVGDGARMSAMRASERVCRVVDETALLRWLCGPGPELRPGLGYGNRCYARQRKMR